MKLTEICNVILEANLTGKSRSGGTTNWNHYVVRNFTTDNKFVIETTGIVIDANGDSIGSVSKGDVITILDTKLTKIGRREFAKVLVLKSNLKGFVSLNMIQKPTTKSKDSIIPGGKNSKEFTPEKLNLIGSKFSSKSQMVATVVNNIKSIYGGTKYEPIRRYLYDCIKTTTGATIQESFSKKYSLQTPHSVSMGDISILSKNFGEVLGALYILSTNKTANYVEFPSNISQGLYDFIMISKRELTNYYSVKSMGGSSTSMGNINFILNNFSDSNSVLRTHKKEIDVIKSLMNNKIKGTTTILNIENFFNNNLSHKVSNILTKLNKISSYKLRKLSQDQLDKWFMGMIDTVDSSTFISTMESIYSNVLGDIGSPPKATNRVLQEIYDSGSGSKFNHGYLIYPMGSYIVSYLNNVGEYKNILNLLLNYGSYIHQLTVNMYSKNVEIQISSFKKQSFRFSYNAGTKYPGNRPIGFIKEN